MSPRKPTPDTDAPTSKERSERGVIFHGDDTESDGDQEREEENERGVVSSPGAADDRGKSDVEREGADSDASDGDDEVTWPGRG